jgi:hypothetical protein
MSNKNVWKTLMYSNPKWWFIGRSWGSKDSNQAADEYEEEILPAFSVIMALVLAAAGVFGLLKLFGAI